jgi:hypothetical protein
MRLTIPILRSRHHEGVRPAQYARARSGMRNDDDYGVKRGRGGDLTLQKRRKTRNSAGNSLGVID